MTEWTRLKFGWFCTLASTPNIVVRRTRLANSKTIFLGIERRLARSTAPDFIVNGLVSES